MRELEFTAPIVLIALVVLPLLWWVLRATPPGPRRQRLPSLRLLHDLPRRSVTPAQTPWWILLLRMGLLACLIIGLAGPMWRAAPMAPITGPVHIVIDNSWASAPHFAAQLQSARTVLNDLPMNTHVILSASARSGGADRPLTFAPLTPAQAVQKLGLITPQSWPAEFDAVPRIKNVTTFVFGAAIDQPGISAFLNAAQGQGPVTYVAAPSQIVTLQRVIEEGVPTTHLRASILRPNATDQTIDVAIRDSEGQTIKTLSTIVPAGHLYADVSIPQAILTQARAAQVESAGHAAAHVFLDGLLGRRAVALVTPVVGDESPLQSPDYYLTRVLSPYADVKVIDLKAALDQKTDVIIAPDLPDPDADTAEALKDWIEGGGILLRFAGDQTAASTRPDFLPVPLQPNLRSLQGLGTWGKTGPAFAPFSPTSPFVGIEAPKNLNIARQALARPSTDPDLQIWASLSDGTPFVTARGVGEGYVVLVHTYATPDGSDFPLHGFFVTLIKQVLSLEPARLQTAGDEAVLGARVLSSMVAPNGQIMPPPGEERLVTIAPDQFGTQIPNAGAPPGLYRTGTVTYALNLAERIEGVPLQMPAGVVLRDPSQMDTKIDLAPSFLVAAFVLMIIDILTLATLQRGWLAIFICALLIQTPVLAADTEPDPAQVHLAYVRTGDPATDAQSMTGLSALLDTLKQRTSITTGQVVGVDIARDDLSFYPLIYWPMGTSDRIQDLTALRAYMTRGGLVVFDTRDDAAQIQAPIPTASWRQMQSILSALGMARLRPISKDHVLYRSFYLLSDTGETTTTYLPTHLQKGSDQVAAFIVRSDDVARRWAGGNDEHARRLGVNIVMYALTGNYKADQVHIPFILDRLGADPPGGPR